VGNLGDGAQVTARSESDPPLYRDRTVQSPLP